MAWAETFTPGDSPQMWSAGNWVEEIKLDQMVANDRYLREQLSFTHLVNDSFMLAAYRQSSVSAADVWWSMHVNAGTTWTQTLFSQGASSSDHSSKDINISAETKGLATLHFDIMGTGIGVANYRIVLTQEIDFISVWVKTDLGPQWFLEDDSEDKFNLPVFFSVNIIGHKTAQGW